MRLIHHGLNSVAFLYRSADLQPAFRRFRFRIPVWSADLHSAFRLRLFFVMSLLGVLALLPGCTGIPAKGEKAARQQIRETASSYRPHGQRPTLPILTTNSTLGEFLTYAMLNQPTVEAAYYDWAASVERITTARSFPDPQLTFQMDIQNVVTSIMPGLMGSIPWPGRLQAGAQAATEESRAKYFGFQAAVLENVFNLKRAYYQIHFLEEKIRVSQETLALLATLEQLARSQNEVGKVTLQDVLRAQIEEDRLRTEIENLADSRTSLLAQFKAALGMKAEAVAPPVPERFESTPLDLTSEHLLQTALTQNTRIAALEAEVRSAEASLLMARRSRLPDFTLGSMADAQMDPTLYRPLGTVSLPIWRDKIAAQIAEAQANQRGAEARLSAEQVRLVADVAERLFVYRESTRNLALLSDRLLPKARQSLEVARSGYLAGQIDFFNLTDSERTLLGFELDRVEASTQRELTLAELSLIIQGMSPGSTPMRSGSPAGRPGSRSGPAKMNLGM
jgi:outer membrane protein, heavy metal efflux system